MKTNCTVSETLITSFSAYLFIQKSKIYNYKTFFTLPTTKSDIFLFLNNKFFILNHGPLKIITKIFMLQK